MSLTMRRARLWDVYRLWKWRNDPGTRAGFRNQARVGFAEHLRWFIRERDARLYVFLDGIAPVGTGRLDVYGLRAEISITVAPPHRGRGYAPRMIAMLLALGALPKAAGLDARFIANIRESNLPSLRAFARCGFVEVNRANGFVEMERR